MTAAAARMTRNRTPEELKDAESSSAPGPARAYISSATAAPWNVAAMRMASFTWSSLMPPSRTTCSWERMQLSQPLIALTARQNSSKSALLVADLGDALHPEPRRLLRVLLAADQMPEAVVDVVHPHQGRRRLGVLDHRGSDVRRRVLQRGLAELRIAAGDGRGHRHTPDLLLGQQHRAAAPRGG